MKLALFTKDIKSGAFAHITAGLSKGFARFGIDEVYVLHLCLTKKKITGFSKKAKILSLSTKHARYSPFALAGFIKRKKPDFIISMPTFVTVFAILGRILAGSSKTRLIAYQADTLSSEIQIDHKKNIKMQLLPLAARFIYRWADGIMAVNEDVLDILKQNRIPIRKKKLAIIPNPVDTEHFAKLAGHKPGHPWLIRKRDIIISSLGRLVKRKNYALLVRAFAVVRKEARVKLIIFGEGPERNYLQRLIYKLGLEKDVSLPGFIDNPWCQIAQSDAFVMPSLDETFCLALAEAMACGVPVIATDALGGGPKNVLSGGKYGILLPASSDKIDLAQAIMNLLNSESLQKRLIAAGRERCKEFSPETTAKKWLSFIKRLNNG